MSDYWIDKKGMENMFGIKTLWKWAMSGLCGALLAMALAGAGCADVDSTDGEVLTEGFEVTPPLLPYDTKDSHETGVIIGSDDRTFTPWEYPYSTVGEIKIIVGGLTGYCTATMVGRMVAITAAHCMETSAGSTSTGTITFGLGFNGSHTGESLTTIGWHLWAKGQRTANDKTNDWAILIMNSDPNLGWLGAAWVPLPTSQSSAYSYPWIYGWTTGYGIRNGVVDHLNRFKLGRVSQGGALYPNWIGDYDAEVGDSGSSFVRNSDGRVVTIHSTGVGANGCATNGATCINLVSASGAWWSSYIAALNANP